MILAAHAVLPGRRGSPAAVEALTGVVRFGKFHLWQEGKLPNDDLKRLAAYDPEMVQTEALIASDNFCPHFCHNDRDALFWYLGSEFDQHFSRHNC